MRHFWGPVVVLLAACGGGDASGPSNTNTPASITPSAGTGQTATVGTAVTTAPAVVVRNAAGDAIEGVRVTFLVTAGGGQLGAAVDTTGATGIATVGSWTLGTTAGTNTLTATVTGLTPASFSATGSAGAATQLALTTQPTAGTAVNGSAFGQQPVVQLRDQYGNARALAGVVVTAAVASGGGTLGGTLTATTAVSGAASFTSLSLTGTVGPRTLSFSATGLTTATSGAFVLGAGPAATVTANSATSQSAPAGTAVATLPAVLVTDQSGNPVFGTSVTFNLTAGGGLLTGPLQLTDVNGIATLSGWTLGGAPGPNSVTATVVGFTPVTFNATATPGAGSRLVLTTEPTNGTAVNGVVFGQQPVVQLVDQIGNPVALAGVGVTASVATGGGSLGGTTTVQTDAQGLATFTDLSLAGPIGSHTLGFNGSGLTGDTSQAISLGAGVAAKLGLTTPPSALPVNAAPFAQQPALQVQDVGGNPVSQGGTQITAAIASGAGVLGGTLNVLTDGAGAASFTDLQITGAVGVRTLSFSAAGLAGATSPTLTLQPGAPTAIAANSAASLSGPVAVGVAPVPSVAVTDVSGNLVSGASVTFTLAGGGGALLPTSPATVTTVDGVASLTAWRLGTTLMTNTVTASSGSLAGSPVTFTATPTFILTAVSAGGTHSCVLTTGGTPYCVGDNAFGGLGDGDTTSSLIPISAQTVQVYSALSAGAGFTCGLTGSNARCWGENSQGELGDGSTTQRLTPTSVAGGHSFSLLTASRANSPHACGLDGTGKAWCWGFNGKGQLGDNSIVTRLSPVAVVGGHSFGSISAGGGSFTCSVDLAGAGWCWGIHDFGQLGTGAVPTTNSTRIPTAVAGGHSFSAIVTGQIHACGLAAGGTAYCWGSHLNGRLGNLDSTAAARDSVPVPVSGGLSFTALAAGQAHTCGLIAGGAVYCWGYNASGQLGDGSLTNSQAPVAVALLGGVTFTAISAGSTHSCGITGTGEVYCWGENTTGQLGDGTTNDSPLPLLIHTP